MLKCDSFCKETTWLSKSELCILKTSSQEITTLFQSWRFFPLKNQKVKKQKVMEDGI